MLDSVCVFSWAQKIELISVFGENMMENIQNSDSYVLSFI
jgi:hypothetical protein